jgi:hypothetical protein
MFLNIATDGLDCLKHIKTNLDQKDMKKFQKYLVKVLFLSTKVESEYD